MGRSSVLPPFPPSKPPPPHCEVEHQIESLQGHLKELVRSQDEAEMGPALAAIAQACHILLERLPVSHVNGAEDHVRGECVEQTLFQEAKHRLQGESKNRYLARTLLAETQTHVAELAAVVQAAIDA